ncbi:methionine sulfoxide reductase B [Nadsonia fulvescens var. elongata DSM 6958]|uniref:Peptide-methionine (R)-S-oxide reductase n=1 Tax=Nadsonia fulvescens var. elongata DSM 6958 TaxID=857566 RepID=A0A1E3PNN2_9ASCO|nr:methionine sulfoxide reductase B [Nadsonia fulvescens var. elongata DSM 6958]
MSASSTIGSASSSASSSTQRSPEQWRAVLSPAQFRVLRQAGTEPPNSYNKAEYSPGKIAPSQSYHCVGCDAPLYRGSTLFDSHCGWPAFYEAIDGALDLVRDTSMGMTRTEMRCANCKSHLGHVFYDEGYKNPTNERHCVNSVCLKLK